MIHLYRVIAVLQEHKIKRCLKLLFLSLRRQAICTILGDLCKQEAAFIGEWILPEDNQEDIRTFYDREPELEKNCNTNKVPKNKRNLIWCEIGNLFNVLVPAINEHIS